MHIFSPLRYSGVSQNALKHYLLYENHSERGQYCHLDCTEGKIEVQRLKNMVKATQQISCKRMQAFWHGATYSKCSVTPDVLPGSSFPLFKSVIGSALFRDWYCK